MNRKFHNKRVITKQGFTLIETLIYIGLFSIIMGGAVIAAYQVFESSGRTQTHAIIETEGEFLVGKINWAMFGVQTISAPATPASGAPCNVGDTLSVKKWTGGETIVINLSAGNMVISRNGNPVSLLNNSNVAVSNLSFSHCNGSGIDPESISAHFTLTSRTPNGMTLTQDFTTTDYVRK